MPGNGHLDGVSVGKVPSALNCAAGKCGGGEGRGEMTETRLRTTWRVMGGQHRQVRVLPRTKTGIYSIVHQLAPLCHSAGWKN